MKVQVAAILLGLVVAVAAAAQLLAFLGNGAADAIGVKYEAIGGHAWSFRNGRWQSNLAQ